MADSTRLSVSACLTMRCRPAPSATRTDNSRSRPAAWTSSKLPTLAHAMRSSRPTDPRSTRSGKRVAHEIVVQRHHPRAHDAVGHGKLLLHPLDDLLELGVGAFRRRVRRQARDRPHPVGAPEKDLRARGAVPCRWCEDVDVFLRKGEALRHDADDLHRLALEANRPPDHGGVAAEVLTPAAMTEDGDLGAGLPGLLVDEATAKRGPDAEHGEEVTGDVGQVQ